MTLEEKLKVKRSTKAARDERELTDACKEDEQMENRVIKFKAWDKKNGKFTKDGELFLRIDSKNYNLYSVDFDNFRLENDNYILIPFTGLKDKNGVEIYEGDILLGHSVYPEFNLFESKLIGEVYYSGRGTWDCNSYILGGFNDQVKVIGNIWEDCELLNDSE